MRGNIHFNSKSPHFKTLPKDNRFNPALAFLVQHPSRGCLLLDTGLHPSFAEKATGNFGGLLGRIVKIRSAHGLDVITQLKKIAVHPGDIHAIILSHLHLDHTSGLPLFRGKNAAPVYADEKEIKKAYSPLAFAEGYLKTHLQGLAIHAVAFDKTVPPFERVCDFWDDGSVFIIGTPGHSPGHLSIILNMNDGPILLTFDAAHRKTNLDKDIPPKGDYRAALQSVHALKAFLGQYVQTRVIFGHDPDQFEQLKHVPDYYA
ncbi:MAG TPA: N-acyl homoserine lactonase family protein [Syntrophorhabdaceae bacterium]|nr:N-acyl homoserine lactonase family protein [Syntrophorhabdaceae bacterium]